ncbi:MAG: zinc ribbon domain-containing protein [Candidatus Dormibacteraeota bacterium]|uniref:Zinc ribbon domain-containing protein n=1 Tax=Candidatus Amunia macphersoniae TaxID=3127014 RepID=A0A934KG01_9BACT|nr:zinc ribbon domain-containing protein [Candidatus Dormibacteraeota bacterium]
MPLGCTRCGTVNPDGNAFCQNCGASLAAAAPPGPAQQSPPATPQQPAPAWAPGPAAAAPAAVVVPPTYYANPAQSQYYAPPLAAPGGTGQVHRLSRNALFAIIGSAVLVIAGVGAIVALAGKGPKPTPYSPPPVVSAAPVTSGPVTPSPTSSGAPRPTPPPGGQTGQVINVGFASFPAISGFTQQTAQGNVTELDPNDKSGQLFVAMLPAGAITTNQQVSDSLLAGDAKSSPDAVRCSPDAPGPTLAGTGGAQIATVVVTICETLTPQNGQAFKAVDAYVAGLAKDSSGAPVQVLINPFAPDSSFANFVKEIPQGWASQVQFNATAR